MRIVCFSHVCDVASDTLMSPIQFLFLAFTVSLIKFVNYVGLSLSAYNDNVHVD